MFDRIGDTAMPAAMLGRLDQQKTASVAAQAQVASGRRVGDYKGLSGAAGQLVSIEALIARTQVRAAVAGRAETHFETQALYLERFGATLERLRADLTVAADMGDREAAEVAIEAMRDAFAGLGGVAIDGGRLFGDEKARRFAVDPQFAIDGNVDMTDLATALDAFALPGSVDVHADIRGATSRLDDVRSSLTDVQVEVADRQRRAGEAKLRAVEIADQARVDLEDLNGVDAAAAVSRMLAIETNLQASYQVLATLQSLSLTRYL